MFVSIGKFIGNLLFSGVKGYLERRGDSTVSVVVLPAGAGKTKLVETFKSEFGTTSTELYLIDIEHSVMSDTKNAGIVAQLNDLKMKDVLLYQSKMFKLCKEHLDDIKAHLKETKTKKHIVVLCSSKDMKKYLGVKKGLYYAPTKRLFETLKTKYPFLEYLTYTRTLLESKESVTIFNTFEELYQSFLRDLKIERTL